MLGHCYTGLHGDTVLGRFSESGSVTTPSQPWFDPTSGTGSDSEWRTPGGKRRYFSPLTYRYPGEYLHSTGLPTPAYNLVNEFDRQGEDPGRRDATGPPVDG
jgi:hypothetical protein